MQYCALQSVALGAACPNAVACCAVWFAGVLGTFGTFGTTTPKLTATDTLPAAVASKVLGLKMGF